LKIRVKKYSRLITPLLVLFDLIIINLVLYYFSNKTTFYYQIHIYLSVFWLFITYYTRFYKVFRYTHILKLVSLLFSNFFVFLLAFFAFFTLFKKGEVISKQSNIVFSFVIIITFFKFLFFFLLKKYRLKGNNYRNVIVFGGSVSAKNIVSLFTKRQDLGYRFIGFFSNKESKSSNYLGNISHGLEYVKKEDIDEIYCDVNSFSSSEFKKIRSFFDINKISFSLIPENKAIYSKDFILEYYGTIPILKPKKLPFERIETHILKRIFDLILSLLICVFLLSWLLPIIWVFVKIDSKGKFIFKQKRDGINGEQFFCYKIRSMKDNNLADKVSTIKNDKRVTNVGAFLRRTSLDELPQFINVLKGDMSIIGPRPHMNIQTEKYLKEIDNYLIRNSVKPGITGLAQVSGYRGEVKQKSDIENRVRLDIFYIENWSFILDVKILMQTIFIVFKGGEKAY